jgi:hypothetical protein
MQSVVQLHILHTGRIDETAELMRQDIDIG